jgi:hypothetical protein
MSKTPMILKRIAAQKFVAPHTGATECIDENTVEIYPSGSAAAFRPRYQRERGGGALVLKPALPAGISFAGDRTKIHPARGPAHRLRPSGLGRLDQRAARGFQQRAGAGAMILTILPESPDRDDRYASIRESLSQALSDLGKQIWRIRHSRLSGLTGAEEAAAVDASAPIEHFAFLLESHANALRDLELIDVGETQDAIEQAGVAMISGIFFMRSLRSFWGGSARDKAG